MMGLSEDNEMTSELVVLLSETGELTGYELKSKVHHTATPLHLAFSCYLFNPLGQVLVTRRALTKLTWPGVWTNSFCGHPAPQEEFESAIQRRAQQELGAQVNHIKLVLPDFRYRAVDASGIVENEICPVFTAQIDSELAPQPSEVCEWMWVDRQNLTEAVKRMPLAFSPWMAQQLPELENLWTQQGEL